MMEAWLSSSERMASSGPQICSNSPALASKHEGYRIESSRPWNFDIFCSSSLCMSCVPQMNLKRHQ